MSFTAAMAVALGLVAADIVLRAVRLRVLLGAAQAPKLIDAIAANAYGDAASAVTPARLGGEPARFVGLKSVGVATPAAIVVLAAERIVDLSLVAVVTVTSLGLLGSRGFADVTVLVRRFVSGDMVGWVAGVALVTVAAGGAAYRLRHRFPPVVEQSLRDAWRETRRLSTGTIAVAAGLTAVSMLLRVSILPVLLAAYTPIEQPASVMVGSFALIYSQLLLPTPAGAGGVEVGFVAGFASSLSGAEVASLLVTWRIFSLVLPAGLGGVLLGRDLLHRRWGKRTVAS